MTQEEAVPPPPPPAQPAPIEEEDGEIVEDDNEVKETKQIEKEKEFDFENDYNEPLDEETREKFKKLFIMHDLYHEPHPVFGEDDVLELIEPTEASADKESDKNMEEENSVAKA